jgi:glycosyltransferase involved in cell wall biosynthesis
MATGVPVITNSGIANHLRVEAGMDLRVCADAAGFAAEIVKLLQDGALRREIGERGRRFVQANCAWGVFAARFEDILTGPSAGREGGNGGNEPDTSRAFLADS